MKINRVLFFLTIIVIFESCKKDDGPEVEIVPPRLLSEVAAENDAEIREYLETHFYNYEEFASPPADFDFKIQIDTIAGENAGKTPLIDQMAFETISVSSEDFARDDGEVVEHTLYYIVAREGIGESPTFADNTVLRYEGSFFNGILFDTSSNIPTLQYLPRTLRGYRRAITNFKTGNGPIENGDGTVSYTDYGIGIMFIPSGLAYFDDPFNQAPSIPDYSPLIFKVDILSYVPDTDFDGDGIPSILEDLNGNGDLDDDNTDEDTEFQFRFPNHVDPDDDGDGIPTREEIIINADGTLTFPDTDGDGIPDYLDSDS